METWGYFRMFMEKGIVERLSLGVGHCGTVGWAPAWNVTSLVQVPAALFPLQLPDDVGAWVPVTHVTDLEGIPGSLVAGQPCCHQHLGDNLSLSLSLLLSFSNNNLKILYFHVKKSWNPCMIFFNNAFSLSFFKILRVKVNVPHWMSFDLGLNLDSQAIGKRTHSRQFKKGTFS